MHIQERVSLAPLTTFKIGGFARYFCRVQSTADILEAVEFARIRKLDILALGGGSNVLLSDNGFDGLVIKIDILGIEFSEQKSKVKVVAGAGENWDDLVRLCVEKELGGLENLSGIPGTVGAAPVQNIGAYGSELADSVAWVEVLDPKKNEIKILSASACSFGYRDSFFKHTGSHLLITRVAFTLSQNAKPNIEYKDLKEHFSTRKTVPTVLEVRDAVLSIRSKKFPDLRQVGTAGSFFKNPIVLKKKYGELSKKYPGITGFKTENGLVKVSLAWIIENVCGLKDLKIGNVGLSPNQALVVCNFGTARASDVQKFTKVIMDTVKEKTGIEIESEVRIF